MIHSVKFLIAIMILGYSWSGKLFGQPWKTGNWEQLESLRTEFFTRQMDMSAEESEAFWPIYNDHQNRRNRLLMERRNLTNFYMQNSENISSEEADKILNEYLENHKKEYELMTLFNDKYLAALPPKKVMKIYVTEIQFRQYLIKRVRGHRRRGPEQP